MENKIMSLQETADMLGVSYVTVNRWTKKGLRTYTEKVLGRQDRTVIKMIDLLEFFGVETEEQMFKIRLIKND